MILAGRLPTRARAAMIATDVHQHLWSERLLALLAARTRPPSLRRAGGEWILRLDGEAEAPVDLAAHRPDARRRELDAAGVARARGCPSSPPGIAARRPRAAAPPRDAHPAGP